MNLREFRCSLGISALQAAKDTNVPIRTYVRYENDEQYGNDLKRKSIFDSLNEKYEITETKGILTIDYIKENCSKVFERYGDRIDCCYLFGSYAKGYATEVSDVDLCISTEITGFEYVTLIGDVCLALHKKIDLIRLCDLTRNFNLIREIMKDGLRIY